MDNITNTTINYTDLENYLGNLSYLFSQNKVADQIIAMFGFVGNFLTLIVFSVLFHTSEFHKKSLDFLLLILTICDTLHLVIVISTVASVGVGFLNDMDVASLVVIFSATSTVSMMSVWTMVIIAIHRYTYCCHPLKVRGYDTLRASYKLVTLLAATSLTVSALTSYFTITAISSETSSPETTYHSFFPFSQQTSINTLITIPLVLIFTARHTVEMIVSSIRRSRMSNFTTVRQHLSKFNKSIMTSVMIYTYVPLKVPLLACCVLSLIFRNVGIQFAASCNTLNTVNSSFKFYAYFVIGREFQETLHTCLTCLLDSLLRRR